ncbi:MAG: DUF2779 domain-containing protein [Acidobacteria bacterium]|nr:DUF2779 domain-containing protein [Acidobacteriota bacterium]
MPSSRYLTKSRFKLALECPTKLFYTGKKDYANQKLDDPFLAQLADGGFQVGALAKLYFPGGEEVTTLEHDAAVAETDELLARDKVTIFEAAIRYKDFFIRADVLIKDGEKIDLIEVKAKSCDFEAENGCWDRRKGTILEKWVPYVADVAFQKWVIEQASEGRYEVTPYLMLSDKSALAATDGLNQKFRLERGCEGRRYVEVSPELSEADLAVRLLRQVRMTESCKQIADAPGFEDNLYKWADAYVNDVKLPPVPTSGCKTCEFQADDDDRAAGLKCGFRECWTELFEWADRDFEEQSVLDIWNCLKKDGLIADGKIKMHQIEPEDIAPKTQSKAEPKPGLDQFARQWLQIEKAREGDLTPHFAAENLKAEMETWTFPLHFIDFETSAPVIPFNKGRRPYGPVAFQFSHHTVDAQGNVAHVGQHLDTRPGVFPNYDFVRELKKQLEKDNGTIFRYHSHENSYLAAIRAQLLSDLAGSPPYEGVVASASDDGVVLSRPSIQAGSTQTGSPPYQGGVDAASADGVVLTQPSTQAPDDAPDLIHFIETIAQPRKKRDHPEDDWEAGPRNMVDLFDLVKRYYYHPHTRGSISIKYVLPAVLHSSQFLRDKYSQPIYGSPNGIPSLNFTNQIWVVPSVSSPHVSKGSTQPQINAESSLNPRSAIRIPHSVANPYKLLPPIFTDESEHDTAAIVSAYFDEHIRDGGAATTAYCKLQFEDIPPQARSLVENALLKYCELDTLAMVMIYEAWKAEL